MTRYVCNQCGTRYRESANPPDRCEICSDDRQYVPVTGQVWTTFEEMVARGVTKIEDEGPNVTGIGTTERVAIGQRALLVQAPSGNVLWDVLPFYNDTIRDEIARRGGVQAIAISHPHYYSFMREWSEGLGDVPIYLHETNRSWVFCDDSNIRYWSDDIVALNDDCHLIRCGGHFPGSTVMHWPGFDGGRGALFTGDSIYVTEGRNRVSIMYSFPNLIPLGRSAVDQVQAAIEPCTYDTIFSAWWGMKIVSGAQSMVKTSFDRYREALHDDQ